MENQRIDKLISILDKLRNTVDDRIASKLDIDKCMRIIQRLGSFSPDCKECYQHFIDLESHINQLTSKSDPLTEDDIKHHKQKIKSISSHLQKQHHLVPKGHYMGIYMSIGMGLGTAFWVLFFENIALGLSLGMAIGIAIGSGLDEDAKKKGMTL